MTELLRYRCEDGSVPFTKWLMGLRDNVAKARVLARLRQVEAGNFGDVASVGEGVSELRIHVGPGYRVYFWRHRETIVLLLCGGDKRRQASDIERAKKFWADWKARQP